MIPEIFPILSADSEVQYNLGSAPCRVYPFAHAPQPTVYPFAVYQVINGQPANYLDRIPDHDVISTQIDVYAESLADAVASSIAIRNALEPHAHMTRFGNTTRDANTMAWRVSMDFDWFNFMKPRTLTISGSYGTVTRFQPYSDGITVTGGYGRLTFTTESTLYGLTLDPRTGVVSGPSPNDGQTTNINRSITVTVTDSRGNVAVYGPQVWPWTGGSPG